VPNSAGCTKSLIRIAEAVLRHIAEVTWSPPVFVKRWM
jgi:hypothetical protein